LQFITHLFYVEWQVKPDADAGSNFEASPQGFFPLTGAVASWTFSFSLKKFQKKSSDFTFL